jgi:hypothetical protein
MNTVKHFLFKGDDYIFVYDVIGHSICIVKNEEYIADVELDFLPKWNKNKATFTILRDLIIFSENKIGSYVIRITSDDFITLKYYHDLPYLDQPSLGYSTRTGENFLIINDNGYIRFYDVSDRGEFKDHFKSLTSQYAYYCVSNSTIYTSNGRYLYIYNVNDDTFSEIFDFNTNILGMERLNDDYILAYTNSEVLVVGVNKKEITRIEMVNVYQDEIIAKKTINFALFGTQTISLELIVTKDGKTSVRLNFYEPKLRDNNFLY